MNAIHLVLVWLCFIALSALVAKLRNRKFMPALLWGGLLPGIGFIIYARWFPALCPKCGGSLITFGVDGVACPQPQCGYSNRRDVPILCPQCHKTSPPGSRFCQACGNPIGVREGFGPLHWAMALVAVLLMVLIATLRI